jgi:hypothetical protein
MLSVVFSRSAPDPYGPPLPAQTPPSKTPDEKSDRRLRDFPHQEQAPSNRDTAPDKKSRGPANGQPSPPIAPAGARPPKRRRTTKSMTSREENGRKEERPTTGRGDITVKEQTTRPPGPKQGRSQREECAEHESSRRRRQVQRSTRVK